ncbi:MAG: acyl transferase, partial [Bacteroidota bacterium]
RTHNPILGKYADLMESMDAPVFLPIEFFKQYEQKCGEWDPQAIFESSGTTGQTPSRHFVKDLELYRTLAVEGFFHFWPRQSYRILALLPSYLERGNSSLVYMVKTWIESFGLPGSGFYLRHEGALEQALFEAGDEPILLIGVAFALLDFAEQHHRKLPPHTIVMETGGMKGRKEEIIREELHQRLREGLGVSTIASEYGMTELLSQMYARQDGKFMAPPWVKVVISDVNLNELSVPHGRTGRINLIDLGNRDSCAFIATDDLGRMHPDGNFEVLGRIDGSELRGCSLMYVG